MRTRIVYLSDDKTDPLLMQAALYLKRAGRKLDAGLLPLSPKRRGKSDDDAKVRAAEAELLLKRTEGCTRVALDDQGRAQTSEELCARLFKLVARGKPLAFLIGGATGHGEAVLRAADDTWSLSPLTLPHKLAVCVLCEQLYRATQIDAGGPYHK